jgi:hypothetical protein
MAEYYFTDKNRDYRIYQTISDDGGKNYSKILSHKVRWNAHNRPDIKELDVIWAEDIMQSIIDGSSQGDFEIMITSENGKEEYTWFDWKILNAWDGWS